MEIQELIRHFWQRWTIEWLPGLNKRYKCTETRKDLKPGDVVLVMNPNHKRTLAIRKNYRGLPR